MYLLEKKKCVLVWYMTPQKWKHQFKKIPCYLSSSKNAHLFTKYHFLGSNLDFNFTNELAMGFFLPRKKLQNPTPFSRYFEWVIFICPPCIIIRLRNRMFSCHGLYCIGTYIPILPIRTDPSLVN